MTYLIEIVVRIATTCGKVYLNHMKAQTIKNQTVTVVTKYYKPVLYLLIGLGLLYGAIHLFTPKPQMPAEYQALIDSLSRANVELAKQQRKLDSTIAQYNVRVNEIDVKVSNIKEKTTVVKEYYHDVIQQVKHYDAVEVDSFFKTRYKY